MTSSQNHKSRHRDRFATTWRNKTPGTHLCGRGFCCIQICRVTLDDGVLLQHPDWVGASVHNCCPHLPIFKVVPPSSLSLPNSSSPGLWSKCLSVRLNHKAVIA